MTTVAVGMTNEQFNSYKSTLLMLLNDALDVTPENEKLKRIVQMLENELAKP